MARFTSSGSLFLIVCFLCFGTHCYGQDLYTARGYWEESTKVTYLKIKQKQERSEVLTDDESNYLQDYEAYLASYYERLSEDEKRRYEQMKSQWAREVPAPQGPVREEEFEWKFGDRFVLFYFGLTYGTSFVIATDLQSEAAVAIPLITGGVWLLGPTINPQKYEGISRTTVRAANTGRILGLLNGAFLGLTITGDSDNSGKVTSVLSSAGSIALGEIGFQWQKKQNFTDGYLRMVRHYSVLCPGVSLSLAASGQLESANLIGASLLAGGAAGMIIGNKVAKSYDYTGGDAAAISSLALISTGIGFTAVAEGLRKGNSEVLYLLPAATALGGTLFAQRAVKGVYLTRKQGSNISLATFGVTAIGLGIVAFTAPESPTAWIGVPSGMSLIAHQLLFNKYKRDNLERDFTGGLFGKRSPRLSMKLMPENYFLNKNIPAGKYDPEVYARMQQPVVSMKVTF